MHAPSAIASRSAQAMWRDDAASQGLGMAIDRVDAGCAVLTMAVTAAMLNGHRTCHGGFVFALADSAFAFACNSFGTRAVAQSCAITYLNPAGLGDVLRAEAVLRAAEGRTSLVDVRVTRGDGTVIAEMRGQSRTVPGSWV